MDGLLDLWLNSGMETRGPVLRGDGFVLRPPEPSEFDRCTELRNAHRRWFADNREIPVEAGRRWLEGRTERDCLLVIDVDGAVVGTVGWVFLAPEAVEIGRMTVDHSTSTGRARRFGLAVFQRCLDHLCEVADEIYAETRATNLPARALTTRSMFTRLGGPRPYAVPHDGDYHHWTLPAARWRRQRLALTA